MIDRDRADAVLVPDIFARVALETLSDLKITENKPSVAEVDAYLWILPKHQALAAKLAEAIEKLRKSGELEEIFSR